jgi:hypothetical protein
MTLEPRVGGGDEAVEIRLVLTPPSVIMTETQPFDASRAPAAGDAAGFAAEDRIVWGEHQNVAPELRLDRGHRLFKQTNRSWCQRITLPHRLHHLIAVESLPSASALGSVVEDDGGQSDVDPVAIGRRA